MPKVYRPPERSRPIVAVVAVVRLQNVSKIIFEMVPLHHVPDLPLKQGQFGRVKLFSRIILVDEVCQLRQCTVGPRTRHRRRHVVDNRCVNAPFRLAAFTRIVDDKWIDQRQVREEKIGKQELLRPTLLPGSHSSVPCFPMCTIASARHSSRSQR